jgi:hypothetical protein
MTRISKIAVQLQRMRIGQISAINGRMVLRCGTDRWTVDSLQSEYDWRSWRSASVVILHRSIGQ